MTELTIKFKDDTDDKLRHSQTFLIHETYGTGQDDPMIVKCIAEARQSITWEPYETTYTIKGIVV